MKSTESNTIGIWNTPKSRMLNVLLSENISTHGFRAATYSITQENHPLQITARLMTNHRGQEFSKPVFHCMTRYPSKRDFHQIENHVQNETPVDPFSSGAEDGQKLSLVRSPTRTRLRILWCLLRLVDRVDGQQ